MTQEEAREIARRARTKLEQIYGERLSEVYLFGSWARGQGADDSDVDIAVVLDQVPDYLEEIERTGALFADLGLDAGVSVSRVFVSEGDFQSGRYALYRSIEREGMVV